MGSKNLTFTAIPVAAISRNDSINLGVDMVTARVNLHFGGPVVAKY
jgi:hypothetical protein